MLSKVLITFAVACLFLQACTTYKPLPKLKSIDREVHLKTSWRRGIDGGFGETSERFNIEIENDSLYLMTNRGTIYQLDAQSGKKIHSFKINDVRNKVSSSIKKYEDLLYFSTYDAELIAVSATTEKEIWRKPLTSEILSTPTIVGNKLAVQTIDGWLSVLNATTGDILWRVKEDVPALTVRGTSSPIITDGKVIAGFADGQVKAFSLFTGKRSWSFAVGKPEGKYEIERLSDVDGNLLLMGNILFSTAYNGTVTAIDIRSGRALWQRNISSVLSTTILDELLIVVDQESRVFALNTKTGDVIWETANLEGRKLISPATLDQYVAVMDGDGYVHLLNKDSGKIVARELADQVLPSGSKMVSKGERLFILTRNEQVTALTF